MSHQKDRPDFYDETVINPNDFAVIANNIQTKVLDRQVTEVAKPRNKQDIFYIRPWRVSFNILSSKVEVVFEVNETLQIGRSPHPDVFFDGLDLSPFNGYEMGVSRNHAEISLQNDRIILVDKKSANGTLLNQQRLEPDTAYVIKHGDEIWFGKLRVDILFLTSISQTS